MKNVTSNMPLFPLHFSRPYRKLADSLTESTAQMADRLTVWKGATNQAWADGHRVSAWTALLLSAYETHSESLMEVETRLGLHGLPPDDAGAIPAQGVLWLLAHRQVNPNYVLDPLWKGVREALLDPRVAQKALDASDALMGVDARDPWMFRSMLYESFMNAWPVGALGNPETPGVVDRWLKSPIVVWSNNSHLELIQQMFTFVREMSDPTAQLARVSELLQIPPASFFAKRPSVRDWVRRPAMFED